ncbi:uncharacterized protein LOC141855701 [Brevipalpus obovatus]|uniref:uncharacterized protein LOC141855701 n=1 Tax=Brevipalpus obovatus TaxID=246614 RepID=UPI003D9DF45F
MLRKHGNSSDWSSATFSYSGGDIRGHFLNSTDYFQIETSRTGSSKEFLVTKFPSPSLGDQTNEFMEVGDKRIISQLTEDCRCNYTILGNGNRFLPPTFVQNESEFGNEKMCVKQKCVSLPAGCPKNCPEKLVQHPDTQEWLPAYILPDRYGPLDKPGNGRRSMPYGFYILVSVLALLMSLALLFIHEKQSEKENVYIISNRSSF